jgi:DNA repair protein RadA/Sms
MDISKSTGVIVLLVGHVTKEGVVAGPRLLEHMVDAVFYFELAASSGYRLVRGQKNRFGATHEVAVFEMSSRGLTQIENPSARFLAERSTEMSGSAVVAHLEGSRPFLTEFQALAQKCYQGYPRRTVQGIDQNRVAVLLAVIEKTLSIPFSDVDVYCKVASGNRIEEPAADLPVLMSLVSAVEDRALPADLLLIGEVGLGGELRSVPGITARLSEGKSVGIRRAIVPAWNQKEAVEIKGVEVLAARTVKEAYQLAWKNVSRAHTARSEATH